MTPERLEEIFQDFPRQSVLVLGDFFLDQYWVVRPEWGEVSLETGLKAHQVEEIRCSPGAAGTAANNLAALGVGRVRALGIIGEDGHGFELVRGLQSRGIDTTLLLQSPERRTPTYTKPMRRSRGEGEQEMERLDIKNRVPTPARLEDELLSRLEAVLPEVDAVVIGDQVEEEDCGVVTTRVRERICQLAGRSSALFFADSRRRIGLFRQVLIKPNEKEAARALGQDDLRPEEALRRLYANSGRPVFLTRGPSGISVYDGHECRHFPALPVRGPIDPVGAGDATSAGIVASLCAGASLWEAAQIGMRVASVTLHKLGTTGTASPEEVRALPFP